MEIENLNLHACTGDTCYCKPGNEHLWKWTEEDKARLAEACKKLAERAKLKS